jgi:hypothetical protein
LRKPPPKINHPHVFSVSQAQTFELCPRKWGFLKLDGLEDPGSEASHLGSEVHDALEGYLERGEPIPGTRAGQIAMSAVPYLPPPKYPGMRIEEWFYLKVGDAYYRGLKDVEIPGGWRSKHPFVSDHKTTKNFMWAKTADDLTGGLRGVGDMQAGVYSGHTMRGGAHHVELQWTYMRTSSSPLAQPTLAVISKPQVARILERLEVTTERMIEAKRATQARDLEPRHSGCSAFGGCPFQEPCGITAKGAVRALFSRDSLFRKKEQEAPIRKEELRTTAEKLIPLSRKAPRQVEAPQHFGGPLQRALTAFQKVCKS